MVLPDVITFDPNTPTSWPNGRGYDDPVVDRLLAAALLKISGPGAPHNINTLVGRHQSDEGRDRHAAADGISRICGRRIPSP